MMRSAMGGSATQGGAGLISAQGRIGGADLTGGAGWTGGAGLAPRWVVRYSSPIEWVQPLATSSGAWVAVQVGRSIHVLDAHSGQACATLETERGVRLVSQAWTAPATHAAPAASASPAASVAPAPLTAPGSASDSAVAGLDLAEAGPGLAYFYDRTHVYALRLAGEPRLQWSVRHALRSPAGFPGDPEFLDEILAAEATDVGLLLVYRSGRLDLRDAGDGRVRWSLPLTAVAQPACWSAGEQAACAWSERGTLRLVFLDLCAIGGAPCFATLPRPVLHARLRPEGLVILDAAGLRLQPPGDREPVELLDWSAPLLWPAEAALSPPVGVQAGGFEAGPADEPACAWIAPCGGGVCMWSAATAQVTCHEIGEPLAFGATERLVSLTAGLYLHLSPSGARLLSAAGPELLLAHGAQSVRSAIWLNGQAWWVQHGAGDGAGDGAGYRAGATAGDAAFALELGCATPGGRVRHGHCRIWQRRKTPLNLADLLESAGLHGAAQVAAEMSALRVEWLPTGVVLTTADAVALWPLEPDTPAVPQEPAAGSGVEP